jgi:hypothetical protein
VRRAARALRFLSYGELAKASGATGTRYIIQSVTTCLRSSTAIAEVAAPECHTRKQAEREKRQNGARHAQGLRRRCSGAPRYVVADPESFPEISKSACSNERIHSNIPAIVQF